MAAPSPAVCEIAAPWPGCELLLRCTAALDFCPKATREMGRGFLGKGLSEGSRPLAEGHGGAEQGRTAAGGGGAGRSLELPGHAGHTASALQPTPSRPHSPAHPALGRAPQGSAQPQQRRARHAQMRRRFYISHLLPRHLCHLALSQPGSFLPNDFS